MPRLTLVHLAESSLPKLPRTTQDNGINLEMALRCLVRNGFDVSRSGRKARD